MKHFLKHILACLPILITTSCATLLNRPYTSIEIIPENTIRAKVGTIEGTINPPGMNFLVLRQNKPLTIEVSNDSASNILTICPQNSFAWYANIFTNYALGMLVDMNNPKRYGYPRRLYLSGDLSVTRREPSSSPKSSGSMYLHFTIPYINQIHLQPLNEGVRSSFGFLGFAGSLEYFHSDNRSIELTTGALTDFFLPFPVAVDYGGEWQSSSSVYMSLALKSYKNRFYGGFGLHISRQFWNLNYGYFGDPAPPTRPEAHLAYLTSGPLLLVGWQPGRFTRITLNYRPGYFRFSASNAYEHVISLEFGWRLKLN